MEPEISLQSWQEPANGSYRKQVNTTHTLKLYYFELYFNIILPPTSRSCRYFGILENFSSLDGAIA
jgi:hypothetical protein